ncbi:MAG TPA: 30S ribosomal protein S6 [Blastocatellia bacterium]|nr:30S ribosomal protein S6 [Blastocatellia bacterium]
MRVYEVLFIVAPNTEESDIEGLITQLSDVIKNQGAQVAKVDRIGRRRLAYQIQKYNEGYYVVLTVEGSGAEIAEVERRMRVTDSVIRYITVRIDEDLKRAEKIKARRMAHAAASARRGGGGGGGRSRRPEPPMPVAQQDSSAREEE